MCRILYDFWLWRMIAISHFGICSREIRKFQHRPLRQCRSALMLLIERKIHSILNIDRIAHMSIRFARNKKKTRRNKLRIR